MKRANYVVQTVDDQALWDAFVVSQPFYTFLHSWAWGEFLAKEEGIVCRVGFFSGKKLVGVALFVGMSARRGKFLFCPHGPLLNWSDTQLVDLFFKTAREYAQSSHSWFVRISPLIDVTTLPNARSIFANHGYIPSPIHMHAERSWTLDITPQDGEILSKMRKTTRYLVRQGEKMGVKVEIKSDKNSFEAFAKLHAQHAKEHNYVPFSHAYLRTLWKVFSPNNAIAVFRAYYKKQLLSSSVILFYGAWAFYYLAITEKSKVPAGYSLVWEVIQEAKRRGARGLNFWGIAPENKPNHPWAGLTLFKQGFGGSEVNLLHAQDLPLSPSYWLTYSFETLRRIRRGF